MPVLTHTTSIFSIDNAALSVMTADVSSAPTYSAKVDLPGVQSATFEPDTLNKELFGDNAIIALAAKARQIVSKVACAKLSLDILAVLLGGTVTDAGATPAQTSTYILKGSDAAKYFKLEFRILGVELPGPSGGGDLHVVFHKAKITDTGLPIHMEDFAAHSFSVKAIPTVSDNKMVSIIENETAVAIA